MSHTFADGHAHAAVARVEALTDGPHPRTDRATAALLPPWRAVEHLAVRALLRRLLAEVVGPHAAGLPVAAHDTGRPHLPGRPDLSISLSHDGGWVAAAVGVGVDVGVDVQPPEPTNAGLLRRCCTPDARRVLSALPDAERDREFAWIWTAQEACVKVDGSGIAGLPWTVPVEVEQRTGVWRDRRWRRLPDVGVPASAAFRVRREVA